MTLGEDALDYPNRGMRIQCYARLDSLSPDVRQELVQVSNRFIMHRQIVDSVSVFSNVVEEGLLRVFDHQMNIQFQLRSVPNRLNHRGSKGEIRHKMAVHHIQMKDPCSGFFQDANVALEVHKICSQQGRNNQWLQRATSRVIPSSAFNMCPGRGN